MVSSTDVPLLITHSEHVKLSLATFASKERPGCMSPRTDLFAFLPINVYSLAVLLTLLRAHCRGRASQEVAAVRQKTMKTLIVFVLGVGFWSCSGFPVYDYESSSLKEALSASVAKVNSQVLSPYLFRAFHGSVKRINILDEDSLTMEIEFSIRETVCRRDSGEDPSTCNLQRGFYGPAATCRSSVKMSAQQVQDVWVHCHWASSSESNSSEEMIFEDMLRSYKWRDNYHQGLIPDESRRGQLYERSPGSAVIKSPHLLVNSQTGGPRIVP
ncbi:PREDICTED: secreted phosphoprotein 24 [Elephantulus edwardii]|uniref:secreted phosphoprotein 24 n=1 Tax=Elephantulus edwardii TaxID=28737 RepID=UPI0003F0A3C6|nr:PREDICTED: secreted phosphoprotein 24 [Elephantulus edwardii]